MSKRILSLALAVLVIAALFVGCGHEAAGYYVIKSINGMDVRTYLASTIGRATLTDAEVSAMLSRYDVKSLEEIATLELKTDGYCTGRTIDGTIRTGKWSQSGSKVTFPNGTADYKNGELTIQYDGLTFIMVRK